MNVLFICEEYPPGKNGGIGTMVQVLGRELVKQGHAIFVAGLYPPGYGQANKEEDSGVKIWRLRYMADLWFLRNNYSFFEKLYFKIYRSTGLLRLDTSVSTKRFFQFVQELIKKESIDIVEMPDWNTFLHRGIQNIQIPDFGVPLVVKFNGSHSYFSKELGDPIDRKIFEAELMLFKRAEALASASTYTASKTKELFQLSKKIEVLHNSIDTLPGIEKTRSEHTVIFTGALVKKKGIHSLLSAWNIVHEKYPGLVLHVYGKGPVVQLKKILTTEAVSSVVFHAHVTRSHIVQALSEASVAIFPSYAECFSFAPMEAMAAGCAVICSSRSSGPELITDQINGLMIDPDNIQAITEAILRLIMDKEFRSSLAEAGKQTVKKKFNITSSAKAHINFYRQVKTRYLTK